VVLVGLNFFADDLAGPGCGVLSISSRSRDSARHRRGRRHRQVAGRARARCTAAPVPGGCRKPGDEYL
jgi:hypothetical protein